MSKNTVIVTCDVRCAWRKHQPIYRAFVGDDLFTERTWIWENAYLEESFQINAKPGKYTVRYELVGETRATLTVTNFKVAHGLARVNQDGEIEIYES